MKFLYNKLRGRIVEKFGSIHNFVQYLDISEIAVSKKLNGKLRFNQNDIVIWSNLLEISIEEIGEYFFTLEV